MNKIIIPCLSFWLLIIMGIGAQEAGADTLRSLQKTATIKVMTFNVRVDTFLNGSNGWKGRGPMVCDVFTKNMADVIGIQEALENQVEDIQRSVPQYSNYMAGRSDGKKKGESCAIFYLKDRLTLDDYGTFWFSDIPEKPGSKGWGNLWPRICSWAHFVDNASGVGFYVYNVHLDVLSQNSRQKSVELLARRIGLRKWADPFIVMGDFNMEIDNPAMVYLENVGNQNSYPRMADAWLSSSHDQDGEATCHGFTGKKFGPKIDHIPLSDNATALDMKIDRYNVNGRYPSDHFPVIATILLNGSPQMTVPVVLESKSAR
ncbi:MAG: hypothetical protein A2Y07_02710 [Planctomycetes bacterium GWF2_50_10]|nr:MAG: hypothetical protein A2Y07_02710 [Planctomycetes bacterium GWF2_50_10]